MEAFCEIIETIRAPVPWAKVGFSPATDDRNSKRSESLQDDLVDSGPSETSSRIISFPSLRTASGLGYFMIMQELYSIDVGINIRFEDC